MDYQQLDIEAQAEVAGLTWPPPVGGVVCLARLVVDRDFKFSTEAYLGDFGPGRYGWKLEVVKVFDPPIPTRGQQGLWDWALPPEVESEQTSADPLAQARRDSDNAPELTAQGVKTTVANIRSLPDGWQQDARYVYIGRRNQSWSMAESKWRNPFRSGDGQKSATQLYREWLKKQPGLLRAIPDLCGKVLVCWCASPKLRMIGSASIGNERQFTYVWRDHERSRDVLKKERVLKRELVRRKVEADRVLSEATRTFRVQFNEAKRAAQELFAAAMDELLQAAPPTD